jgi:DNA-binding Lrp family transcriptional regulator
MPVSAYILMQVGTGKARSVADEVSKVEGVRMAHAVTGIFDVIAFVEVEDLAKLIDTVLTKIQAIDGVLRTQTALVAPPPPAPPAPPEEAAAAAAVAAVPTPTEPTEPAALEAPPL